MNRLRSTARALALGLGSAILVTACGSGNAPSPSNRPSVAVAPAPSLAPATSSPAPNEDDGDLLVLRRDGGTADRGYAVIDGGSMEELFSLPVGVPSADWRNLYTVSTSGSGPDAVSTVSAIDPNGGRTTRTMSVPGAWQLPTIGSGKVPAGLAGNGRVLILVEPPKTDFASSTRFAIVTTDGSKPARVITLAGSLEYDALGPDGSALFVLQHVSAADPTYYVVRTVDLATGALVDGNIVDKRDPGEAMGGFAVTQISNGSGFVYTVYRGAEGPFIHALDTSIAVAFCIDLPGPDHQDDATAAAWGLTLAPNGKTLYATNGVLGTVSEVDLDQFSVTRTSRLADAGGVSLAKFGAGSPIHGGQSTLAQDGSTLFVIGANGLSVVRTHDLASVGEIGGGRSYRAVAVSSSGRLYILDGSGGISSMDAAAGSILGGTDSGPFSGIVAVIPHG